MKWSAASAAWFASNRNPEVSAVANRVLINYLAEFFEVREKSIHIMRGEKAREKTIQIIGRSEDELKRVDGVHPLKGHSS